MDPFGEFTPNSVFDIERYLEDKSLIYGDSRVTAAIVRYLNKRGECVMNISTIIHIVENG